MTSLGAAKALLAELQNLPSEIKGELYGKIVNYADPREIALTIIQRHMDEFGRRNAEQMTALDTAKTLAKSLPSRGDDDKPNDYFIETLAEGLEEFAREQNYERKTMKTDEQEAIEEAESRKLDELLRQQRIDTINQLEEFVKTQANSLQEAWDEVHKLREQLVYAEDAVAQLKKANCESLKAFELSQEENHELLKDKERLDHIQKTCDGDLRKAIDEAIQEDREALDKAALAKGDI